MKHILRIGFKLAAMAVLTASVAVRADDTDIFLVNPSVSADRPNVLIMLDNTANWNTPFTNEKNALVSVVNALDDSFNVGLAMFVETGNPNDNVDGAYVRFGIRQMSTTNKTSLSGMVNALDKISDKGNNATYGLAMDELYLYYKGLTSRSGVGKAKRDYGGSTNAALNGAGSLAGNPLTNSSSSVYNSPISGNCQKNFIIFISNGPASDNNSSTTTATTLLSGAGGNTTTISLSPSGEQDVVADEWSRFLANTDLSSSLDGTQNVITYTVDVNPGTTGQGPAHTAQLKSMALQGKGEYFSVTNDATAISTALQSIFDKIKAVNTAFAASTLPVSVNNRGYSLNQVYMGVFRPDSDGKPQWPGNMKLYQIAQDPSTGNVYLSDQNQANAVSGAFVSDTASSFWTSTSTFWSSSAYPNITGGVSDSPDGPVVEKGGAAQRIRSTYATSQSARNIYTCTDACTTNSLLSATPFSTANTNALNTSGITTTALLAADNTERDNIINWVRGANNNTNDPTGGSATGIRGYHHGDVIHSQPAVINYNRSSQPTDRDIVVYYGANDGMFHAVKGGRDATDGLEKWAFIPKEFFSGLKRLRDASPTVSSSVRKSYFADGPIGVYTNDADGNGQLGDTGDSVNLYIAMRRGGRFLYALDVNNPDAPKLLWTKSNSSTGYSELGQTWSTPVPIKINYNGTAKVALVFGGGYATEDDTLPAGTASMGNAVFIVDAANGNVLWKASPSPSGATVNKQVTGMTSAIAADVTAIDSDGDGSAYVDRLYVPDMGGNIWRINIGDSNPSNWTVGKLAALAGAASGDKRKFMNRASVVSVDTATDAVLLGSGDREHPLDTTITDRFYMVKDSHTIDAVPSTALTESDLYDATSNLVQVGTAAQQSAALSSLNSTSGWYITLGTGEKVTSLALTLGGTVTFNTILQLPTSSSQCVLLPPARVYELNFQTGASVREHDAQSGLGTGDRYTEMSGAGFLPNPTAAVIKKLTTSCDATTDPTCNPCKSGIVVIRGTSETTCTDVKYNVRQRIYWRELIDS